MPIYEFRCLNCKHRFEIFVRYADYGKDPIVCPFCGSSHTQRKIGRIRVARSSESRLEQLADPEKLASLEDDPQALGSMMRQMSDELGEDVGPEFDEVVSRLEAGQTPEQIEKEAPDLADDGRSSGLSDDMDF